MSTSTSPNSLPPFLQQSKADIKAKFVDLEWAQRERLLQGTQQPVGTDAAPSQWARLTGDTIVSRNRYQNVEPYASNRVRLRVSEGENDYINASPIILGKRRYIATQGPKDVSVAHFYKMLASEVRNPAVVVMLTQTHEAGREKCFQYYPLSEEDSPMVLQEEDGWSGEVTLESVEDNVESRCQVRRMRLRARQRTGAAVGGAEQNGDAGGDNDETVGKKEDEGEVQELEIKHLLFSGWPDFLIPEGDDRAALVNLVALSATLNSGSSSSSKADQPNGHSTPSTADPLLTDQSNQRIIHCSAGVGRSGTFIALDYLLSMLHSGELDALEEGRDPIVETVDELRKQRMMMVQGESQFGFLYEALREAFELRARSEGNARNGTDQGR